jgi:uncharacterized protein YfkK (UPF0435 family)
VEWSVEYSEMVVWYYDVDMAAEADLTDDDLDQFRKNREVVGPSEIPTIADVRRLIAESKHGP